ncbi:hypothetical protein [Bacillus sp. Marseille-P3661]|uniref:hypothetical protein n=1 Tax=Bacillus sp. Marseille-P3661 TaxID=1936234 RepID=UPI000C838232|nr:hypothetical protein [Bacillus sp. Marseille-P3661]
MFYREIGRIGPRYSQLPIPNPINQSLLQGILGQALNQLPGQVYPPYTPPTPSMQPLPYQPIYTQPTSQPISPPLQGIGQGGLPARPPATTPTKPYLAPGTEAIVDVNTLNACLRKCTFVWLKNGSAFWTWISQVQPGSLSGYYWNGYQWTQLNLQMQQIEYFKCFTC